MYLTYDEYKAKGGELDQTAFNRFIDRACGIIARETFNRIDSMSKVPEQAKALCRDLVEYLSTQTVSALNVTSKSQSAGPVSESESYTAKSKEEQAQDIENLVLDYLSGVTDDNGTPLLYRGCGI